MNRELKRKAVISVAVHTALLIFLIIRSFISCYRIDTRNISPFIDVQMGAPAGGPRGGGAAVAPAAAKDDDAFPESVKKKGVEVSKKLIKRPSAKAPLKKLSENQIKRMLGEGVALSTTAGLQPGSASGAGGGGGTYHPYALYLSQIRAVMYDAWQQPSSLIGKKGLVTTVEIRVQRDGQITAKKIAAPSGNAQMDDSVARAIESVTKVPELPPGFGGLYKDITVDFELTDAPLPQGE